ncbi:MAG: hypothetical protein JNJ90_14470 [Saprospiraceae bacterium]|nr:hypothetical protein [Saprospiraceae bacterium]
MTRFFKFSATSLLLIVLVLAEARGQKVTDVAYFSDGNRIVLTYNISKSWIQLPHFLRRKVWILPALDVPGKPLDFDTMKHVTGDVGQLERPRPGSKIMVWDFSKDLAQLPPDSRLTAKLITNRIMRNRTYTRYYVPGWSGTPQAPFGISFAKYGLMGWYAGASVHTWPRSGVVASSLASYKPPCNNCTVQFDPDSKRDNFDVAIGINRKITKWNYLAFGVGLHGREEVYKATYFNSSSQEIGSQWVSPERVTFWAGELGITHRFSRFFVEARVGLPINANWKYVFPAFSLGYAIATRQVKRF